MATYDKRACSANLVLVAPPISNTLAANIASDDAQVIEQLRRSHFYMICGRPKATFGKIEAVKDGSIAIEIRLASGELSHGFLYIKEMSFFESAPEHMALRLRSNEDVLKIFLGEELVFATAPDHVLMMRGRKQSLVSGFDNHRDILTFDLLYVGIAKSNQDSYSRLIEKGHKARVDILAAEKQRTIGARVSDETYLLLFEVQPIVLTTFAGLGDLDGEDLGLSVNYHRIIADAEKAVISAFKPKYNKQLYKNYPQGSDGLYGQGFTGYAYSIAEGFAFNTAYGTIRGARDSEDVLLSNDADFISVNGDEVSLHIAGKDFNIPLESMASES
ncbi:TPA: hypothetical protein ACXNQV_000563 [Stenotrophomonas maltophilia]